MSTARLVRPAIVHRGLVKLTKQLLDKPLTFPEGTKLIAAFGPNQAMIRYGEASSSVLVEHPEIEGQQDGSKYAELAPVIEKTADGFAVVAWKQPELVSG